MRTCGAGGQYEGSVAATRAVGPRRERFTHRWGASYAGVIMAVGRHTVGALGELLASRWRGRFVGRTAEIELFREALDAAELPFSVLYLQGPAGIGKTSLLAVLAGVAAEDDATVVSLDGRELVPSPSAVLETLGAVLDVPAGDGLISVPVGRLVLILDCYERMDVLDDWIRARLLPRLPSSALTVIASRNSPAPAWRADPGWRELLRVVSLRNLSPEESRRYLERCGIDAALHDWLLDVTHGHPLGLSLFADVVARGGAAPVDPLTPDLVGTLLRRLVDVVPDVRQRQALEVCALSRVTTEALLRHVLAVEDAHAQFEWLRDLSVVESGPDGVFPHDLARDALEADLRWRDPDSYRRVFRRVRAYVHNGLRSSLGREQRRAISDLKFLFRNLPSVLSPVDWDAWGQHYPEQARTTDRDAVLELVETNEGEESAAIAERWWDRQQAGFFVVRGDDDAVRGVLGLLDLTAASEQDRAVDPGAQAAWDHAHRHAPPRRGEVVTQSRFIVDREVYQEPSPTLNATPIVTLQRYLRMPNLACDYLTLAEPERWDAYFALADLSRAGDADFLVAGRRYGLFWHDFRQTPVDALVELWTERALAQDVTLPPPQPAADMLVLSQPDFADAVRQALRDLNRPDLLARNPLLRTRLIHDHAGKAEADGAVLQGVLHMAVEVLSQNPRDDKILRAVERTYVRPASTQEAAARALGVPFSTYRRHLTQGVARIVAWLWEKETHGPA
jgi:hypothetical protein